MTLLEDTIVREREVVEEAVIQVPAQGSLHQDAAQAPQEQGPREASYLSTQHWKRSPVWAEAIHRSHPEADAVAPSG